MTASTTSTTGSGATGGGAGRSDEDTPRPGSRADRLSHPRARDVVVEAAIEFGVCIRPVLLRRTNTDTGETTVIEVPCGNTRAKVCRPCADRARKVRAQQCREGWHLDTEPEIVVSPATRTQHDLINERASLTEQRETALESQDLDTAGQLDTRIGDLDAELAGTGARGQVSPPALKRVRSTKRRHDVPDLPRRPSTGSTLGRTYTDPKTKRLFRPSMFVTLTLPSYGRVRPQEGTPVDPAGYDYVSAARDALHFGKLLDRWAQNLRRVAGYDAQYFAAIEPQRRGAPHAHYAIRGTLPRAVVKELTAATYVNVWWPTTEHVVYTDGRLPVWNPALTLDEHGQIIGGYVDPDTGQPLLTWRDALDDLDADPDALPRHTIRFGTQIDAQGVLAGSPQAERAIGYLVKYLVKDLGDDLDDLDEHDGHDRDQDEDGQSHRPHHRSGRLSRADAKAAAARRADHRARLVEALRFEPCSPGCTNWLRYGIQPKNPRQGMRPGCCRAKAHKPTHLGYGGRRVLASRRWTNKDLRDHRHDRHHYVRAVLAAAGLDDSATDPAPSAAGESVTWELARPTDPDVAPRHHRLLRAIARRQQWRTQYRAARDSSGPPAQQRPDTDHGGQTA